MLGSVEVQQLGSNKGPYSFFIHREGEGFIIRIPGHGGGRDGPRFPDKPEQEEWMRRQSHLKEIWYLNWSCEDRKSLHQFLKKIGSNKRF